MKAPVVVDVTTGWAGVGTGSQKMNGATIFIGFVGFVGFVDKDGKVQFKPRAGSEPANSTKLDLFRRFAQAISNDSNAFKGGVLWRRSPFATRMTS